MHRRFLLALALLASGCDQSRLAATVPVPGPPAEDLRVSEGDLLIGGIDRSWHLFMSGAPMNLFDFHRRDMSFERVSGTYEVGDGMVTFTGIQDRGAWPMHLGVGPNFEVVRLETTYQLIDGKAWFGVARAEGPNTYKYMRRASRRVGDTWMPFEETQLQFVIDSLDADHMTAQVRGSQRSWTAASTSPTERVFDDVVVYQRAPWGFHHESTTPWPGNTLKAQGAVDPTTGLPACLVADQGGRLPTWPTPLPQLTPVDQRVDATPTR